MKRYSILTDDLKKCFICKSTQNIHIHEVLYGTANRKKSIEDGLCIGLCGKHHNLSNKGVHFNKDLDIKLKKYAQKKWIETNNKTIDDWLKRYDRNYL